MAPEGLLVITHGWSDSGASGSYLHSLSLTAQARLVQEGKTVQIVTDLANANLANDVIIYEFVWDQAFTMTGNPFADDDNYVFSFRRTDNAGEDLSFNLAGFIADVESATGADYDPAIHFVGHSLGTMVNAYAVKDLHFDFQDDLTVEQVTVIEDPLGVGFDPAWTGVLLGGIVSELESSGEVDPLFYNRHILGGSANYVENIYANQVDFFGGPIFNAGAGSGGTEINGDHGDAWQVHYAGIVQGGNWVTPLLPGWTAPVAWLGHLHPSLGSTINGSGAGNNLPGTDFNDVISGFAGDDNIAGGFGNDILLGGLDDDELDGGPDTDTASYEDATSGVRVKLSSQGTPQDTRGDGLDTLISIENLTGSAFDDFLKGDAGDNVLSGLAGNDILLGSAGADTLLGGADDDRMRGRGGPDMLEGGLGRDTLRGDTGKDVATGGADKDIFRYKDGDFVGSTKGKAETITDFTLSDGDRINVKDIDAIVGGSDDAFTFIGTAAFSGTAGELRYEQIDDHTYVQADTDGSGAANFMIELQYFLDPLVPGNFIL